MVCACSSKMCESFCLFNAETNGKHAGYCVVCETAVGVNIHDTVIVKHKTHDKSYHKSCLTVVEDCYCCDSKLTSIDHLITLEIKAIHLEVVIPCCSHECRSQVVSLLLSEQRVTLPHKCGQCQRLLSEFKTCSSCRVAVYCSKNCQTQDWSKHKARCATLRSK